MKSMPAIALLFSCLASPAHAQNFYALAKQKGCESVMPTLQSECQKLNDAKNKPCESQGTCEIDEHQSQIAEYKDGRQRLESGDLNESDKSSVQAAIDKIKGELDARKAAAEANERLARSCADARQAVYDFFSSKVIPDTDRAVSDAVSRRKTLIEELDKAKDNARTAKDKRDTLADADPEKDKARWEEFNKAKDEYDKATEAARQAENNLGQFNSASGDDPADGGKRLLDYYKSEQDGHKIAIEEQKLRAENCGKVEYMSY
jgi:hypothetical protein